MNRIALSLVAAGLATLSAFAAQAKPKAASDAPAKLTVCRDYKIVGDKTTATSSSPDGEYDIAVCFDGGRGTILRHFSEVTINVAGEGNVKVVIGSR